MKVYARVKDDIYYFFHIKSG